MYTIMHTIWFKVEDETCSADAESLDVARILWDALSSKFHMVSPRP